MGDPKLLNKEATILRNKYAPIIPVNNDCKYQNKLPIL